MDIGTNVLNTHMHYESLANDITQYLFHDDDMYRKNFVPCYSHMCKNPKDTHRVHTLVDSVCKKFAETKGIPTIAIGKDVKRQVAINVFQEMINSADQA